MRAFEYANPTDVRSAVQTLAQAGRRGKPIAGGIDLLGEMKDYIETPDVVVNLKTLPGLGSVEHTAKGLRIGALVTLAAIVEDPAVREHYTALSDAAGVVGTPQIRNVGTIGGNLCQRPRCWYYRDEGVLCLKKGGDRCYAVEGESQIHSILGGGPAWYVHPSDCAPALMALGGSVTVAGPKGTRTVPLDRFFVLPADDITREVALEPGEIVTLVTVPTPAAGTRSRYLKVRHRESFDWALAGAAVSLDMVGGVVRAARVVLSGVAPIPWRSPEAEKALRGHHVTPEVATRAGEAAVAQARALPKNAYKIALARNVVRRAVLETAGVNDEG